jgi:hypothetical protein
VAAMRALAGLLFSYLLFISQPASADGTISHYDHVLIIISENQGYDRIIGQPYTPRLNGFLQIRETGLADNFFGEVHPSQANYIALLGGDTFGIHDDDAWYCKPGDPDRYCSSRSGGVYPDHTITARSLMDQLAERNLTWKGYFEDIPAPGWKGIFYPDDRDPVPGKPSQLYAAKHNGFLSFKAVQDDPGLDSKIVGFDQLKTDLGTGHVPNYAHIVPNQCNDMHGLEGAYVPPDCRSAPPEGRIARGDKTIGELVDLIMASPIWTREGNTAIVITWDEDHNPLIKTGTQVCCACAYPSGVANFGGGHIPTFVLVNHPPGDKPRRDSTPYNHYSLLRTVEEAFGINEYLGHANETGCGVQPMTKLFQTKE